MFPFEFILIQLLLCIVIKSKADIISVKTNMRYQTFYESQMARSYMDCMALCVPLGICAGASYNRITTECQLSDVNSEDALDNAEGWTSGLKGNLGSFARNSILFQ